MIQMSIPKRVLSPMAGYTDTAFRKICSSFGADAVVSEMISSVAMVMNDKKTAALAKIAPGEAPCYLQIFGHDPATMARAADLLLSGDYAGCSYDRPPAGIDINMGCPVKKIVTNGDGSALMKNIPLAASITAAVKEVCLKHGVPLSVKFRAGWDDSSLNAPAFALALAKSGADLLTVHCRTREQMYAPGVRMETAAEVVTILRENGYATPVIGNGDVDGLHMADGYTALGCAGVAVGRAALGNPWLFAALKDPASFVPPTQGEIIALILSFVEEVVREKGEVVGIRESRGRAAHFLKGMRGSARIRDRLNHCETFDAFAAVLSEMEE